jgi:hypothetical protein
MMTAETTVVTIPHLKPDKMGLLLPALVTHPAVQAVIKEIVIILMMNILMVITALPEHTVLPVPTELP